VIAVKEDHSGTNHASMLTVFIRRLCDENHLSVADLDAVAVSAGPGSYTGLRIGVATSKGICFSIGKPLLAIDSLQAFAEGMRLRNDSDGLLYCSTIDARRNEIYYSLIESKDNVLIPSNNIELSSTIPFIIPENRKILIGGNGALKSMSFWNHSSIKIDSTTIHSSKWMARLAEIKFLSSQFEDINAFEPSYIKPVFFAQKNGG